MPTFSLYQKKSFLLMDLGASIIAESVRKISDELVYLDLNAYLNMNENLKFEEEDFLNFSNFSEAEKIIFQNTNKNVINLLKGFIKRIEEEGNLNEYDFIAYSVSQNPNSFFFYDITPFIFTLIFNHYIQRKLNHVIPSYIGGSGVKEVDLILRSFPNYFNTEKNMIFPNEIFLHSVENAFPIYLLQNFNKHKENNKFKTPLSYLRKVISPEVAIPNNHEDLSLNIQDKITKDILLEFPELSKLKNNKMTTYNFSKNCMFNCSFCDNHSDDFIYYKDFDILINNFRKLRDHGIRNILFTDTNVNFNLKWLRELCERLIKEDLGIKWSISANLSIYDEFTFKLLKAAGCVKLWFGAETISSRILKINNKNLNKEKIIKGLQLSSEANIWNNCNFIVNFPTETAAEFSELKEFIKEYYTSDLIDGFVVNYFLLKTNNDYFDNSEKYGIEIIDKDINKNTYQWDDFTGRTPEEINNEGLKRKEEIYKYLKINNFRLFESTEHLFFSLHDLYNGDKEKIKKVYNYINDNGLSERFFFFDNLKISEKTKKVHIKPLQI